MSTMAHSLCGTYRLVCGLGVFVRVQLNQILLARHLCGSIQIELTVVFVLAGEYAFTIMKRLFGA